MEETQGNRSLLIVEDDPSQLAEYAYRFEELGYQVCHAVSAEEAIVLARTHRFAAILTDNILPGMTGLRSLPELMKCSRAPVFVMTSHHSPESEQDALLLGAKAFLKKPLDFAKLHQDLQKVCRERS